MSVLIDKTMRILDVDRHLAPAFSKTHAEALKICKETGAILDLATSDVVLYVETTDESAALRVAKCYPDSQLEVEKPGCYVIL